MGGRGRPGAGLAVMGEPARARARRAGRRAGPTARARGKPVTAGGGQAPGMVKVRLSGAPADLEAVTALLAAGTGVEVLTGPDGPYPNRRDAGARVYLTIRTGPARPPPGQIRAPDVPGGLDIQALVSAIGDLSCQLAPPAPDRPATVTVRPAVSIERARAAWATAPRDSELDRWRELYALAVPAPRAVPDGAR